MAETTETPAPAVIPAPGGGGDGAALPALAATGLLACAEEVYDKARAAFYGLASLVLAVVFAALVGEARAEGLTRLDAVDVGRLLGLERAPESRRCAGPSSAWSPMGGETS